MTRNKCVDAFEYHWEKYTGWAKNHFPLKQIRDCFIIYFFQFPFFYRFLKHNEKIALELEFTLKVIKLVFSYIWQMQRQKWWNGVKCRLVGKLKTDGFQMTTTTVTIDLFWILAQVIFILSFISLSSHCHGRRFIVAIPVKVKNHCAARDIHRRVETRLNGDLFPSERIKPRAANRY